MKKGLMIVAVLALGFTACKKDSGDGGTAPKTTSEKIIGSWKGDKVEISLTVPGVPPQTQSEDISYLNMQFKSDGTAVADSAGLYPEVSTWALIGDDKIILDMDTFDIQTLNDNQFYFGASGSEDIGGGVMVDFSTTIKLKK